MIFRIRVRMNAINKSVKVIVAIIITFTSAFSLIIIALHTIMIINAIIFGFA